MPVIQPSQIFISYSRVDSDFVDRLETDLRAHGHQTWVDRMHLEGGDDWAERIGHEIAQSGIMIVVLSPDAVASKWVRREITVADERNMPIFPILFKAVSRVPLQIAERQYIDFTTGYDKALQSLLLALAATNQRQERTTVADVPNTAPRTPAIAPKIKDAIPGDLVKPHPVPTPPNLTPSALNHPTSDPTLDMLSEGASSLQPSTRQPLSRRRFIIGGASVAAVATVAAVGIRNQSHPTKPVPAATKTPATAQTIAAQQTATATAQQVILSQHRDFIYDLDPFQATSAAWSPDSKRIVSVSYGRPVKAWNATDGSHSFTYSTGGNSVAWSSPTATIQHIAAAFSGAVWVLNPADGSDVYNYQSYSVNDLVSSVAWSPNGQRIASANYNKNVQVWNAVDGSGVYIYTGHSGIVNGVAWSRDGQRIASASFDGTVQVWTAADGSDVYTYSGHSLGVSSVAWSPIDNRIASASKDKTVRIWNATDHSNDIVCTGHTLGVNSVVWAPNGKHIASASDDSTVRVWDATNGNTVFIYPGHLDAVNSVAWSPDGQHIASASSDSTVQVWHL